MDRTKQGSPNAIPRLHKISHLLYNYDSNNRLTGIKFMEQSLGIDTFSGTTMSATQLDALWDKKKTVDTCSSSFDPLITKMAEYYKFLLKEMRMILL